MRNYFNGMFGRPTQNRINIVLIITREVERERESYLAIKVVGRMLTQQQHTATSKHILPFDQTGLKINKTVKNKLLHSLAICTINEV